MWRDTDDFSYFPRPFNYKQNDSRKRSEEISSWKVLGAICGRSILDERIFDMRFSEAFWKVILGRRVGLSDLATINGGLMKTLSDMQALANEYQLQVSRAIGEPEEVIDEIKGKLSYNGVKIEDLCLVFTLPGYEDYELMPSGADKEVTLDNLELYVDLVTKTYLIDSIMPYVEAFRDGISMVHSSKAVHFDRQTGLLPTGRDGTGHMRQQTRDLDPRLSQGKHHAYAWVLPRKPNLQQLPPGP